MNILNKIIKSINKKEDIMEDNMILFHITKEQAEKICKHFKKDFKTLEEYEITELLDTIIDELEDN